MTQVEALEGMDPLKPEHTCPRCRETWAFRDVKVQFGLVVRVYCVNNHAGSAFLPDLPDRVLLPV